MACYPFYRDKLHMARLLNKMTLGIRYCFELFHLNKEDKDWLFPPPQKKMQLDVGVSPPANIMTFRPGLTYLTFDLDLSDL